MDKLVVCVMERRTYGFFLAPYDLGQKKFVGPVKFVSSSIGRKSSGVLLQEAIDLYSGPEIGAQVDGATDEVFALCLEYGVVVNPKWMHYSARKKR